MVIGYVLIHVPTISPYYYAFNLTSGHDEHFALALA